MVWRSPTILRTSAISSPTGKRVSRSTPSSSPSIVQTAKPAVARLMLFQRLRLSQHFTKIENVPLQAQIAPRLPAITGSPHSSRAFKALFAP